MAKRIQVGGRIESKEVGGIVTGAAEILDDAKEKKQSVINQETDDELLRLDHSKQNNLTFDNAPTEGSDNPVKSGGVYAADKALSDAIEAILLLIPSAASALNKLVDTAMMNSSISTATATFRGTYNVVTDLSLTVDATHEQIAAALGNAISTADNNDYAFVQVPVSEESTDIRRTERYKFNGTAWGYEYDLNTSGFTDAQWAAINSGITLALVGKLIGLPTSAELQALLGQKQDTLAFDNIPVSGSANPVKSGGVYSAINDEKTAREQLAQTVTGIDGRVENVEGVIPTGAAANNKLVANNSMEAYVTSIIDAITASFTIATADGHINLTLTQTNGRVASLTLTSSDIASAQALTALTGRVITAEGNITTINGNITSLGGRVSTNETDIANLQQLYNDLQQSKPVPVTDLPSTGQQQGVIYRLAGTTSYSDYMWNGSTWVLMATYNNAIDDVPTSGSDNLVKSRGVLSVTRFFTFVSDGIGKQVNYNNVLKGHIYRITPMYEWAHNDPSIVSFLQIGYNGTIIYNIVNQNTLAPYYDVEITPDIFANDGKLFIWARGNVGEKPTLAIEDITYLIRSVEFVNPIYITEGKGIGGNSGTEYDSTVNSITQYINVEGFSKVKFVGNINQNESSAGGYSFYTEALEPVGYHRYDVVESSEHSVKEYQIYVPNTAKYFRFTIYNDMVESTYCKNYKKEFIQDQIGNLENLPQSTTSLVDAINRITPSAGEIHTETIPMMFGEISSGYPVKGNASERWNKSYSKIIKINGALVSIPNTRDCRCTCYDENFNSLGSKKNIGDINLASYVRFICDENNASFANSVEIQIKGNIEYINEPKRSNTFSPSWFTVDVAYPMDNPATEYANLEPLYTNAWISLPYNYRQSGQKNKLIVYGTGTGGAPWNSVVSGQEEKVTFFNAMGYGVLVVNPNTNKYKDNYRTNCMTPLGVSCFVAAVEYAVKMYNMDENIYVYAKSDGGLTAMSLINNSQLHIKAAAIHCPNLDIINSFRCIFNSEKNEGGYFAQFNLTNGQSWDSTKTASDNTTLAEMKTKQDEFDGYNPMTCKCTIDKKSYNDFLLNNVYPMLSNTQYIAGGGNMKEYSETYLLASNGTMERLVKDAKLMLNIPVKIWYTKDDEQVPYGTIVNFAKMASNAGCVCKLREFPMDTGGHGCADAPSTSTLENVPRADVQTRYGTLMEDLALGIAEALQWLEQW